MILQNIRCMTYVPALLPIQIGRRNKSFKIPKHPVYREISKKELPTNVHIEKEMIEHLERLALVDFANPTGIERLQEAIRFADQLSVVDTTNVEPMISSLDNKKVFLAEDHVTEGSCRKEILQNANKVEEYYFVAPLVISSGKTSNQEKSTDLHRESGSLQNS